MIDESLLVHYLQSVSYAWFCNQYLGYGWIFFDFLAELGNMHAKYLVVLSIMDTPYFLDYETVCQNTSGMSYHKREYGILC